MTQDSLAHRPSADAPGRLAVDHSTATLLSQAGIPDPTARPERLLIVARVADDAAGATNTDPHDLSASGDVPGAGAAEPEARFLFARWADWPYPAMLSIAPPQPREGLAAAVQALLGARMGVRVDGDPLPGDIRIPVRMHHPYTGSEGLGWLRPLAVTVRGEPDPDPLLDDVEALTLPEALDALPSEVERIALRSGAALFA